MLKRMLVSAFLGLWRNESVEQIDKSTGSFENHLS